MIAGSDMHPPRRRRGLSVDRLRRALSQLADLSIELQQVRRTALGAGGEIRFEIGGRHGPRWFAYTQGSLSQLHPHHDISIPLAATLTAGQAGSGREIVSYRPDRRLVLGPASTAAGDYMKAYRRGRSAKAAHNYELAFAACRRAGFDAPRLIRHSVSAEYLVMTACSGRTPEISPENASVWSGIGVSLSRFQRSAETTGLALFTARHELSVMDELARRFMLCCPALPPRWRDGRDRLGGILAALPGTETGLAHRDLHDGQLLTDGRRIGLLDFDLLCRADTALDAGNLLAHLKLRSLQSGEATGLEACSSAFLGGLDKMGQPGFEVRLHFYRATTCYRLALLYALRPRWAHLAAELVASGERCIQAIDGQVHGA